MRVAILLALGAFLLAAPGTARSGEEHAAPPALAKLATMPFNVPDEPTQADMIDFAWRSFIALNWPHKKGGERGEPDRKRSLYRIDSKARTLEPVVWETYFLPGEVFLAPDKWPYRFDPRLPAERARKILSSNATDYAEFAEGINQPYTQAHYPTGPVVDQNRNYLWYEVTMGQSYAAYVAKFGYYNADCQAKAVKAYMAYVKQHDRPPPEPDDTHRSRYFQHLPTGAEPYLTEVFKLQPFARHGMIEVKAAWKFLRKSDVPERYFRRAIHVEHNGRVFGPHTMGLVGLHIHRVTPMKGRDPSKLQHLASTFEHIDNVALQEGGPLPLPAHAALNPGTLSAPVSYPNGYEVDGKSGIAGLIPKPIGQDEPIPPRASRPSISVSREVPIPPDVQKANDHYRKRVLKDTVWFYYQLIGTQNRNVGKAPNDRLGPGIPGAQHSNTQNLINTTLESYTQRGFSCARCHLNAWPHGVTLPFPAFEEKYSNLHVMSFLLLNAKSRRGRDR